MESRWTSRIWTGVEPHSSNPSANRGTSKLIRCAASPASKGLLPPVAQARQSQVVSLTVFEETPEEITTYVAPTQPSAQEPLLVLMLPDGAMAEEAKWRHMECAAM